MKTNKQNEIEKYRGKIIQVVHVPTEVEIGKIINFEVARRAPGVRLIIINNKDEVLLSREFRYELGKNDFRLPGGKVFDKLETFLQYRDSEQNIFNVHIENAVRREALEECGIKVNKMELIKKSTAGATIEWDLYYYLITDFQELESGQILEVGEDITTEWYSKDRIRELIKSNEINEDRSISVLVKKLNLI